jgi:hypothetical protein
MDEDSSISNAHAEELCCLRMLSSECDAQASDAMFVAVNASFKDGVPGFSTPKPGASTNIFE